MKPVMFIFCTLTLLHGAAKAQAVDFDAAGKLTGGLIVSAIGNTQSKLEASSDEWWNKGMATRELIMETTKQNTYLAGATENDYSKFNLANVTKVDEYIANAIKIKYYTAVSDLNLSILNAYARKSDIDQISTTGNYILFEGKWGKNYDYRALQLENYILPDEFVIPVCNLSDNSMKRQPFIVKAFGFLTDCDKCKNLSVNHSVTGKLSKEHFDCNSKTENKNIDSSMYYMRLELKTPQLNSNVDLLDYFTTRVWYNMLKMQQAKKTSDILELLEANMDFYQTIVTYPDWDSRIATLSQRTIDGPKEGKMDSHGRELNFASAASIIGDYYFYRALLTYYEIKKTGGPNIVRIVSGDEHGKDIIADIKKILEQVKK